MLCLLACPPGKHPSQRQRDMTEQELQQVRPVVLLHGLLLHAVLASLPPGKHPSQRQPDMTEQELQQVRPVVSLLHAVCFFAACRATFSS